MIYEELLTNFHRHIMERAANFGLAADCLPTLECLMSSRGNESWFAVQGMYGGFSYSLVEAEQGPVLDVSSWSRIVGGSGKRYKISATSIELVEEGFV